jgi:hypothetical protein
VGLGHVVLTWPSSLVLRAALALFYACRPCFGGTISLSFDINTTYVTYIGLSSCHASPNVALEISFLVFSSIHDIRNI